MNPEKYQDLHLTKIQQTMTYVPPIRRNRVRTLAIHYLLASLLTFACGTTHAEKIPAEDFYKYPNAWQLSLSPDGKYVVGQAPVKKGKSRGLVFFDLEKKKSHPIKWTGGNQISRVHWASNTEVIFGLIKWNTYAGGIFRMNREKRESVTLIGNDAAASILDPLIDNPTHSWVWIRNAGDTKPHLAKVSINRNTHTVGHVSSHPLIDQRVQQPLGEVFRWVIGPNEVPRIVSRFHNDKLEYLHRHTEKEDWQPLSLDPEEWDVVSFDEKGELLYITGYNNENTKGLYLYDIKTDTLGDCVFRDNFYDFSSNARYLYHKDVLLGIRYQRDTPAVQWLSKDMEQLQNFIDRKLPGMVNIISDWSHDFTKFMVASYNDSSPVNYYLLDLNSREFNRFLSTYPWLEGKKLAETEVLKFTTPDGLALEGYLTRPTTGKAPYPMVTVVHGGPWVRDTGGYDDQTQFLANRGYAVLRVNYRGSSGYSKAVSEDPEYDFLKMHDDITQATKLAVKMGIADPDRLAIMGGSFGGYAAICGAAFEPDLYQCAITVVGVFDWAQMIKDRKRQKHYYSHKKLVEEFGSDDDLDAELERISPINKVDQIKIPIFIVHGKGDTNVPLHHSKKLEKKLKQHNVEHETLYREWEGHGFSDPKNQIDLAKRIEEFLSKHMK